MKQILTFLALLIGIGAYAQDTPPAGTKQATTSQDFIYKSGDTIKLFKRIAAKDLPADYYENATKKQLSDSLAKAKQRVDSLMGLTQKRTFGNFEPYEGNPLLFPAGSINVKSFVSVVYRAGTYYKYYTNISPSEKNVYVTTSTDGKTGWTTAVLALDKSVSGFDDYGVRVPIVWWEGNTCYMLYTGQNTASGGTTTSEGLATSTDGITFIRANGGNAVLSGTSSEWDQNDVEASALIKVGNTYYMYYSTRYNTRSSGVATSTDLINWTKDAANPIFGGGRYCPEIIKYNAYYYLFIPHYTYKTNFTEFEVYRDSSPSFHTNTRAYLGVAKKTSASGWDRLDIDVPFILTDDIYRNTFSSSNNQLWMYYSGTDNDLTYSEGLAIADQTEILSNSTSGAEGVGYSKAGTSDAMYQISNTTTDPLRVTIDYRFSDYTNISKTAPGHPEVSFYSSPTISSGNILRTVGFLSQPTAAAGTTLTTRYGGQISDVLGTGTLTDNIGLIVDNLTRGTNNTSIQTGSAPNIFQRTNLWNPSGTVGTGQILSFLSGTGKNVQANIVGDIQSSSAANLHFNVRTSGTAGDAGLTEVLGLYGGASKYSLFTGGVRMPTAGLYYSNGIGSNGQFYTVLPVAQGGTGKATITSGALQKGNGTGILADAVAGTDYEAAIGAKGTAFNKNFGTGSGTVAEGNDSRINNGQTAFSWGNHASAGYAPGSGSSNYVQIQTATDQTGGFRVSGTSYANGGLVIADFVALKKTSVPAYRIDIQPPTLTTNRVQTLQDKDGVIALTSDVTGNASSGTYTPTITNTLNVTSSTAIVCHWKRNGNEMSVQGQATITNGSGGGTEFQVSLVPGYTSNLGSAEELTGIGASYIATDAVFCDGDPGTDRARVRYTGTNTGTGVVKFSFTYTIIP